MISFRFHTWLLPDVCNRGERVPKTACIQVNAHLLQELLTSGLLTATALQDRLARWIWPSGGSGMRTQFSLGLSQQHSEKYVALQERPNISDGLHGGLTPLQLFPVAVV
jgi:hypothetical protein